MLMKRFIENRTRCMNFNTFTVIASYLLFQRIKYTVHNRYSNKIPFIEYVIRIICGHHLSQLDTNRFIPHEHADLMCTKSHNDAFLQSVEISFIVPNNLYPSRPITMQVCCVE